MDIAALLVFTAISGHIIAQKHYRLRYLIPRVSNGQQYYLQCLLYGLLPTTLLFALFLLFNLASGKTDLSLPREQEIIAIGLLSVIVTWIGTSVYNRITGEKGKKQAFIEAVNRNDFDLILYESMENLHPIALTMESRKVYIGLLFDGFEPSDTSSYLTIIPLLSGYRDKDTLNLTLTHKYQVIIDLLKGIKNIEDLKQFTNYKIAFPRNNITSLHLYNEELYHHIQEQISEQ